MLGRSRPSRPYGRTHAYLVLLRIEVAAFHPAMPPPVAGRRGTEMAVPVRARRALMTDSSLWPCSSAFPAGKPASVAGRPLAAIPPCGVRTFLEGFASPRLPDLPCGRHFNTAGAPAPGRALPVPRVPA